MSRRKGFAYSYETYFECPYCPLKWGGQRLVQQQGLSRQKKPLAEQDERVQADYRRAVEERDAHLLTHRAETIAVRMAGIEREAKWATDYATSQGEELDWATHPLAVEWRALMRDWWALPPQPHKVAMLSPTYNRSLLGKGVLAPPTAGERHMSKVESHQRKLRLERSGTAA